MKTDELHPAEAQVIEDLHRRDWIIEKESHKDYGHILAAARKQQFSAILENAFLKRLDEATHINEGDSGWIGLHTLLVPVQQDVEMFKWIVGSDDAPIGIDDNGRLYVSTGRALDIFRGDRDKLKRRLSSAHVIIAFLVVLLMVTVWGSV